MITRHAANNYRPSRSQIWRVIMPWLCVAFITFIVVQPLLGKPPRGADTLIHFYRIPVINSLLQHGILFSRWSPDLIFGYGYPLFNFYPMSSAYLLALTYWLSGANALVGWNAAYGLALILTSIGMFGLGRRLFGNIGGIFATAAYTLSPYVAYQTFERSSLSNALALACVPYAVWAVIELAARPTLRRGVWAALAVASVFLAHMSTSTLMIIPLWAAGLTIASEGSHLGRRSRLFAVCIAVLLGLALSAFVWLPALAEIQYTRYQAAVRDVEVGFADLPRWPAPVFDKMANPDLPLSVGSWQLVFGLAGSIVAAVTWLKRRRSPQHGTYETLMVLSGLIALVGLFFATSISAWWWANVPLLKVFQFPPRWLDLSAFWLALPCGWLAQRLFIRSGWRAVLGAISLALVVANVLPYLYPLRWETALPAQPTLSDLTRQAQVQYGIYGLTSWGEYAPATVKQLPTELPIPGADSAATLDQKLNRADLPENAVTSAAGGPTHALLYLHLTEPKTLTFHTFYFPGWMAELDDRSIPIGPDEAGRIAVDVPAGEHQLAVSFGETPLRLISDVISITAGVVIGLALLFHRRVFAPKLKSLDNRAETAHRVDSTYSTLAIWCVVLGGLALAKVIWFDRADSPVVQHVVNDRVPGASVPALGNFGDELKLLGYHWYAPDQLELYWQAQRIPSRNYRIEINLVDAQGVPSGKVVHDSPGYMLTSRWEAGQLVRDEYTLPLQEMQRPIGYYLSVAVIDPVSKQPLTLSNSPNGRQFAALGTTKLPPAAALPVDSMAPIGAQFDGRFELERAAVSDQLAAGATLSVTLLWHSVAATPIDYTVFVHLTRQDGSLAATGDAQPRGGIYPTSFWSPGERILDEHVWPLQIAPGEYQVSVGLYRLDTGERLKLAEGEDHVVLKTIHVTSAEATR